MWTFALSVAGFVLAIIANVWSFGLTLVRWPRVSVETHAHWFRGDEERGPTRDGRQPGDPLVAVNRRHLGPLVGQPTN